MGHNADKTYDYDHRGFEDPWKLFEEYSEAAAHNPVGGGLGTSSKEPTYNETWAGRELVLSALAPILQDKFAIGIGDIEVDDDLHLVAYFRSKAPIARTRGEAAEMIRSLGTESFNYGNVLGDE